MNYIAALPRKRKGWLSLSFFLLMGVLCAAENESVVQSISSDNNVIKEDRRKLGNPAPTHTYERRGQPLDDRKKNELKSKWGSWNLVDSKASSRPKEDIYAAYPSRDIPFNKMPSNAWQKDEGYMKSFLEESKALVGRAMDVILAEYGYGKDDDAVKGKSLEERSEMMFGHKFINSKAGEKLEHGTAGATTHRSFEGLVRRVLHAIMTQDTFTVVMGGHSAAAGHGNHFSQTYTMQIQKVLEPVFARLGVKMTARNVGMGGLGTLQNAMGAGAIYGRNVDFLIWDSGMTERSGPEVDLFFRQSIIGSTTRVPYICSGDNRENIVSTLHDEADVDVSLYKFIPDSIPKSETFEQVRTLPWAVQFLHCSNDLKGPCRENRYNGTCWIPRDDYEPDNQQAEPGGRASWHPGHREHQIVGRVMAFNILNATYTGINRWLEADKYQLPDEAWHVKDYYKNTLDKLTSLDEEVGRCYKMGDRVPAIEKFCTTPFKAKTEFTPRADPADTSLTSIMKMPDDVTFLTPKENAYNPPDVWNPQAEYTGAINYLDIIENGVDYAPIFYPKVSTRAYKESKDNNRPAQSLKNAEPGKGWTLATRAASDNCDGTYGNFCGRDDQNRCLLYGHNDGRNGLKFDSLSGWGIFKLKGIEHGVIVLKIETWHQPGEALATADWTTVNGEKERQLRKKEDRQLENHGRRLTQMYSTCNMDGKRQLEEEEDFFQYDYDYDGSSSNNNSNRRKLKPKPPHFCDEWRFEYSINGGKIESLDAFQFCDKLDQVQRVVQQITILNDDNFVKEGEAVDVELAIRMTGCGRDVTFQLTHIYWA